MSGGQDMAGDGSSDGFDPLVNGVAAPGAVAATSAGVSGAGSGSARPVQVSISIAAPAGSSVPQSLQRSSRQIASAVRRAIGPY